MRKLRDHPLPRPRTRRRGRGPRSAWGRAVRAGRGGGRGGPVVGVGGGGRPRGAGGGPGAAGPVPGGVVDECDDPAAGGPGPAPGWPGRSMRCSAPRSWGWRTGPGGVPAGVRAAGGSARGGAGWWMTPPVMSRQPGRWAWWVTGMCPRPGWSVSSPGTGCGVRGLRSEGRGVGCSPAVWWGRPGRAGGSPGGGRGCGVGGVFVVRA